MNKLYFGDCLTIMEEMPLGSVDLIYLDPPFNSQRDYNAIYKDETGRPLPAQIEAFGDMWELNEERERELRTMPVLMREAGIPDESVEFWRLWMNALRRTNPNLLAYLSYMTQRLLPMRGLLRPTGSIYLHCDPTASHYIKVMMDSIFRHENFRNEIIWKRTGSHGGARKWGPIHDVILFYSKGDKYKWNREYQEYSPEYLDNYYKFKDERGRFRLVTLTGAGTRTGHSGKPWRGVDPTVSGRHWAVPKAALTKAFPDRAELDELPTQTKLDMLDEAGVIHWPKRGTVPQQKRYVDESPGVLIQDIITDIKPLGAHAKERLGYNTQKPVELLDRLIAVSTDLGDVVFDPFCGCATTIEAAQRLGRRWVGVDIAIHAVKRVAAFRLRDRLALKEGEDFEIDGVPRDIEGARDMWTRDKYHFQRWAVEQVDGFVTTKRTADGGIDGRLYFGLPNERDLSSMAIEVKGGKNVGIKEVRELRGVLDNDQALIAGLIILEPFGKTKERNIRRFMADAGDMDVLGVKYPRMQVITVADILEGKRFHTPGVAGRGLAQPALL